MLIYILGNYETFPLYLNLQITINPRTPLHLAVWGWPLQHSIYDKLLYADMYTIIWNNTERK